MIVSLMCDRKFLSVDHRPTRNRLVEKPQGRDGAHRFSLEPVVGDDQFPVYMDRAVVARDESCELIEAENGSIIVRFVASDRWLAAEGSRYVTRASRDQALRFTRASDTLTAPGVPPLGIFEIHA